MWQVLAKVATGEETEGKVMGRLMVRQRQKLASFGWRLIQFTGKKGFCSVCMRVFEQGEMKWGYGGYLGHYHEKCLAGLLIYAPRVFSSISKKNND